MTEIGLFSTNLSNTAPSIGGLLEDKIEEGLSYTISPYLYTTGTCTYVPVSLCRRISCLQAGGGKRHARTQVFIRSNREVIEVQSRARYIAHDVLYVDTACPKAADASLLERRST